VRSTEDPNKGKGWWWKGWKKWKRNSESLGGEGGRKKGWGGGFDRGVTLKVQPQKWVLRLKTGRGGKG